MSSIRHCPYNSAPKRGFLSIHEKREIYGRTKNGITVVYLGDLSHSTYAEIMEKGSERAIYISDKATPEQRKVLDILLVNALGGAVMKKVFGVQYVKIDIKEGEEPVHVKMPYGEMKMRLTKSHDGNSVRLENTTLPFL